MVDQFVRLPGFGEVAVQAELVHRFLGGREIRRSRQDHAHAPGLDVRRRGQQLHAAHVGHAQIADDDIKPPGA